jgi:hypothetical protein
LKYKKAHNFASFQAPNALEQDTFRTRHKALPHHQTPLILHNHSTLTILDIIRKSSNDSQQQRAYHKEEKIAKKVRIIHVEEVYQDD